MADAPIDGQLLVLTAAKASVPFDRLVELVETTAQDLAARKPIYERQYERAIRTETFDAYFVESDHWNEIGSRLELSPREVDGVRRAHEEQLGRVGRESDRAEEFERAMEIRSVVVIGRPNTGN